MDELISEAANLVAAADARGLSLRVTGSLAFRMQRISMQEMLNSLGREEPADIDLVGLGKQWRAVRELMEAHGYTVDQQLLAGLEYGTRRLIFYRANGSVKVDLFLDAVVMSHTLDFRERLHLTKPTVPLIDLLLTKLQIHQLTQKDAIDAIVLLAEHDFGSGEGQLDLDYAGSLLRNDWGFWFTVTSNLLEVEKLVTELSPLMETTRSEAVLSKIAQLRSFLEDLPKSIQWRIRARVGMRRQWFEEVGDVER